MSVSQQPVVERKSERKAERRSMPDRTCIVCLDGVYVTRLETDSYAGRGSLSRFGVDSSSVDVLWHVEACNNCGHVLIFRRDWRDESP